MKNNRQAVSPEQLLETFTASHDGAPSFSVKDAVDFVAAALKPGNAEEKKRLERDVELILEGRTDLFYRSGSDTCYNRAAFFKGTCFKIVPAKLEIKEGILFYGARFAPFCSDEVFPDEYLLRARGAKTRFQPVACPVQFGQVARIFQMLGRSAIIDCIVAESDDNYKALKQASSPEKACISLTAFNLEPFFRKHSFSEGDALIATVEDWKCGQFSLEYVPKASLPGASEREAFLTNFEEGIIQSYEEYGAYLELADQIAHAYLCAFLAGKDLRKRPVLSLDEYPALMRDVAIHRDGPDWTLAPVDETAASEVFEEEEEDFHIHECTCGHDHGHGHEPESGTEPDGSGPKEKNPLRAEDLSASAGKIGSLDALLEDVNAPLDYTEIYAMILDDLVNGQESSEVFVSKLIDFMGVKFADDAQEAVFWNFIEDCWENAAGRFNPVTEEPKTPLRTRLLELNLKRIERSRVLLEEYSSAEIPKEIVRRMKHFHAQLLNTLGLLNADSALPEGSEYDLLELRVGDIEDAWDVFEEQFN